MKIKCINCGKETNRDDGVINNNEDYPLSHDFCIVENWENEVWCKSCYMKYYKPEHEWMFKDIV